MITAKRTKFITLILAATVAVTTLSACQPAPYSNDGRAVELSSKERNLIKLAHSVERGGDIKSAIDLYSQAINLSKGRVEAYLALSRLYSEQNQKNKAKQVLLEAKKKNKYDAELNHRLGKMAVAEGNAQQALTYFEDGLKFSPQNIDLLNGKAIALDMLNRHSEAQEIYQKAISLDRNNSDFIRNNLAMSYIMSEEYDQAISLLENNSKLNDSEVMRQNLALAYGLSGNMKEAYKWGIKDLPKKQVQENIKFYKEYKQKLMQKKIIPMLKPQNIPPSSPSP